MICSRGGSLVVFCWLVASKVNSAMVDKIFVISADGVTDSIFK